MVTPDQITGLVLAGGRASRMGGVDKGLQRLRGKSLAGHVLRRLRPQVGAVAINANRHRAAYEALGVPVWPDNGPADTFAGPLAGFLSGLRHSAPHPGFGLAAYLQGGSRTVGAWVAQQRCTTARFDAPADDAHAFSNINTLAELVSLQTADRPTCRRAPRQRPDADG